MKRIITAAIILFSANFMVGASSAAELFWDGDGFAPLGGNGIWNTSSANWWNGSGYQAWSNSNGDDAVFGTTGGIVGLPSPISVHDVKFLASGYSLQGSLKLLGTAPTFFVAADSTASVTGGVTATEGLKKSGPGLLDMQSYNNALGGTIEVSDGALRLASGWKTSNLNISGGIVELNSTAPVTLSLGTAQNQVQFSGSGGFSAATWYNSPDNSVIHIITLSLGTGMLAWGSGGFVPNGSDLILSSPWSNAAIQLQNDIDLGATTRTIHVEDGLTPLDAVLNGSLSGSGGLLKTGNGVLTLGKQNSYVGSTTITTGVLTFATSLALPGGMNVTGGTSNLNLAGGVAGLGASGAVFNRALGSGPDQVQFTATGGFSGRGTVNIGGKSTPLILTWGSGGFVPDGETLILGAADSSSSLLFMNPIAMGNATRTIRCDCSTLVPYVANAEIKGAINGTNGVTKTGNGVLKLSGANTYSGETQVAGGVLQLANTAALPGGIGATGGASHLHLSGGGKVTINTADFQRNLGPNPTDVQFSGSGGFFGGSHSTVNFGGASAPVIWDANPYLPDDCVLILENVGAAGPMTLQNPLVLGAGQRTISTSCGSDYTHARLSASVSGVGGLTKTGGLVLDLIAENTYSGETEVNAGVLRLTNTYALPGGVGVSGGASNLNFSGVAGYSHRMWSTTTGGVTSTYYYYQQAPGVVELTSNDFTRSLGKGPAQVQFTGSGGFSAFGENRIVNLGAASAQVAWGSNCFVPDKSWLCLSSTFSNATIDFQNPIDLGSSSRTIMVDNGSATIDAKLSGILSGTGELQKFGDGTLSLNATNTYTGNTYVNAGTLILDATGTLKLSIERSTNSSISVSGSKSKLDLFGTIALDIGDVASSSQSWTLVRSASGTITYESSFALTTTDGASFNQVNDVWTYIDGSRHWTFTESTSMLSLITVPEPSSLVLLGLGGIGLFAFFRRERKHRK